MKRTPAETASMLCFIFQFKWDWRDKELRRMLKKEGYRISWSYLRWLAGQRKLPNGYVSDLDSALKEGELCMIQTAEYIDIVYHGHETLFVEE